ncbi:MAG: hypothetical protein OFPI_29090 [Osedax symbiont Rs2]|nr:MAG: hypothetical protein OFPI_29090 [Osedax symbiont Rs2]
MKHLCCAGAALLVSMNVSATELNLEQKVQVLIDAYPQVLSHQQEGYLYSYSGAKWLIEDGLKKTHQQALENPDIEDSLRQQYPLFSCEQVVKKDFDPGRVRHQSLMMALYGEHKKSVVKQLKLIKWFDQSLRVTQKQNVAAALIEVQKELLKDSALKRYATPSAGVFNWRFISGTQRLSVHSFGAAIDLNLKFADYWKWRSIGDSELLSFKNKYPRKLIEIFEKHGFIWGGKWYHYDSMHFEYRPELLKISRMQGC